MAIRIRIYINTLSLSNIISPVIMIGYIFIFLILFVSKTAAQPFLSRGVYMLLGVPRTCNT